MNKKLIIALIAAGTLSASTFAMGNGGDMGDNGSMDSQETTNGTPTNILPNPHSVPTMTTTASNTVKKARETFKEERDGMRNKFRDASSMFKNNIKTARDSFMSGAQALRKQYQPQIKEAWKALDKNVKSKIKDLRKQYKPQIQVLKAQFQNATATERQQLRTQLNDLRTKIHSQIATLAAGTDFEKDIQTKVVEIQAKRQEALAQIKEMRNNFKQVRTQFRDSRQALVVKWKKLIISKLSSRVDSMSLARLEKIETRIENAVPKLEARKYLSEDKKAEIISALDALKQVITERITKLKGETSTTDDTMSILGGLLGK